MLKSRCWPKRLILTTPDIVCLIHLGELDDFLYCIYRISDKDDSALAIQNAFAALDEDKNGFVNYEKMKRVLKTLGEPLSDNELEAFFSNFTIHANGTIPMAEIMKILDFTPNYKAN